MKFAVWLVALQIGPLWCQDELSVHQAVGLGLRQNESIAAAAAGVQAAESQMVQARSSRLPKIDYSESFIRSDNPVFVFSSLLTQHQFGEQNFSLGPLNRPDALNNFQSLISLAQPVFDAGQSRRAIRAAAFRRDLSEEEKRRAGMELIAVIVRAYYSSVLAEESLRTARQAVRSTEADLRRAESIRAAGMSTDADLLSIRVHLAAVNEHRIRRSADLDVARAALNDALGVPLDSPHKLTSDLEPANVPELALKEWERSSSEARPEMRQSRLASNLAEVQVDAARSARLPRVDMRAAFEADRQTFATRGGANWTVGATLTWNLFNGFSDRERISESGYLLERARAEQRRANSAVRLQVRRAYADVRAAGQRIEAARASVAEAEESLRITQNRYESGMSNVTDLLRTETSVLESRTRYLAAIHDQRIAAVQLELAAGRLSPASEVLN